jgi:hypothetical protein
MEEGHCGDENAMRTEETQIILRLTAKRPRERRIKETSLLGGEAITR